MSKFRLYLPQATEELLGLGPEELARGVLRLLVAHGVDRHDAAFPIGRGTTTLEGFTNWVKLDNQTAGWYSDRVSEVNRAIMEAWSHLERTGLLAAVWNRNRRAYFVTNRGLAAAEGETAWQEHRESQRLPAALLHPVVRKAAWSNYARGQYDVAVFAAMKEVEVAVREASGGMSEHYGVALMRRAFQVKPPGPLTDASLLEGEQEAMAHLFAGAIGLFKNPHGHRHHPLTAGEAAEALTMASHLLRVVDAREGMSTGTSRGVADTP